MNDFRPGNFTHFELCFAYIVFDAVKYAHQTAISMDVLYSRQFE